MFESEYRKHIKRLDVLESVIDDIRDRVSSKPDAIQRIDYGLNFGSFDTPIVFLSQDAFWQMFGGRWVTIVRKLVSKDQFHWTVKTIGNTEAWERSNFVYIHAELGENPFYWWPELRNLTFEENGFIETLIMPEFGQLTIKNEQDADNVLAMFDYQQQG